MLHKDLIETIDQEAIALLNRYIHELPIHKEKLKFVRSRNALEIANFGYVLYLEKLLYMLEQYIKS